MRKITLLIASMASLAVLPLFAQKPDINRCGTTEYMQQLFQQDPSYEQRLQEIEEFTQQWIKNNPEGSRTVITIPVVIHVVYNINTPSENITDAQCQTQIDVLNEDFRRLNPDVNETPAAWLGVAADCEINFCLAQRDPNGNATNGIVHVSTTKTSFSDNDNVKFTAQGGDDIWDRNKYLNIWCCDLSGGLLGYAQFPGGPATTDGVVCDYFYFGRFGSAHAPYNLGRTATHEIGHWMNLYHIWGNGFGCNDSDQVSDTPNQDNETFGCPLPTIRISCNNGPDGDMYPNYMDYTDDGCMNLFTTGQKSRMQAVFAPGASRDDIVTSDGCVPPVAACTDIYEPNDTKGSAVLITTGVTIEALISTATDKDFFKFKNTSAKPNFKVTLSSMPQDYDLDLFNPSGVKIASSQNAGTEDEILIINGGVIGTYKVKVYSGGGGFDASDCYNLLAEKSSTPFKFTNNTSPALLSGVQNIYPNPSDGNVTVVYNSATKATVQLIAYDMVGRIVYSAQKYATEGDNTYEVSIPDLTSGIYMFVVKNGSTSSQMKFTIEK